MPDKKAEKKNKGFWSSVFKKNKTKSANNRIAPVLHSNEDISESDAYAFDGGTTVSQSLLGGGKRSARTREQIYSKWGRMESDPIIATALRLLVTAALGGHETTGDTIFIEKAHDVDGDKNKETLVRELNDDLSIIFNNIAFQVAYNAVTFGDSYGRPYIDGKNGIVSVYTGEMVRPPLIQPFERGDKTIGFITYSGKKMSGKLNSGQLVRMRMPRSTWVPQQSVVEKGYRFDLEEDNIENLELLPAMVGGSLLYSAEEPYDNLTKALLGLTSQRWIDSIDEKILSVNLDGMTKNQRERFLKSLREMFLKSKEIAERAINSGEPVLEKTTHIMPVFGEKQLTQVTGVGGSGRTSSISVEDVMIHAKLLSSALGIDLSQLGFSEILSGGLGEGGFYRASAQIGETSRIIRNSLETFYNDLIDLHTYHKYGVIFTPSERPWQINFYGSISALDNERQQTKLTAMNAASMAVGVLQQLTDMGKSPEMIENFLVKQLMMDESEAKIYSKGSVEESNTGESHE